MIIGVTYGIFDYISIDNNLKSKINSKFSFFKYYINSTNAHGVSPLQYACYFENKIIIDALIDLGSDINHCDKEGDFVLNYAIKTNNVKIVKKLLLKGASPLKKNSFGLSPINYIQSQQDYSTEIAEIMRGSNCIEKLFSSKIDFTALVNPPRYDLLLLIISLVITFYSSIVVGISALNYINSNTSNTSTHLIVYMILGILAVVFNLLQVIVIKSIQIFRRKPMNLKFYESLKDSSDTLVSLYSKSPNLCIRCYKIKEENTIHCITCDVCVDNWNHHCYWLDICISDSNIFCFYFFVIIISTTILINLSFTGVLSILFLVNMKENTLYTSDEFTFTVIKIISLVIFILFFSLGIFLLLPSFIRICSQKLAKRKSQSLLKETFITLDNDKSVNQAI